MVGTKTLADALTGLRFVLGFSLMWLGWWQGPEAIVTAALILLAAWTSDALDGPLARRDPRDIHTWIGDRDLAVDLTVALGVWVYLALSGFLHPWLALAYLVVAAVVLWRLGSDHLAWGLQALPYGAMIWTTLREAPVYGYLLVAWVVVVVAATWPRFPRQTLPGFLNGMRDLWHRR